MATTLMYDVSQWWSQYLNSCVDVSTLEVLEVPGDSVVFYLEPIMVDLEGGCYMGPILMVTLTDLPAGRWTKGGNGIGGSGSDDSGGGGGGGGSGGGDLKNKYGSHWW